MATLEKRGDDQYAISGNGTEMVFSKEKFEDLFYAVPPEPDKYMASGHFYRLLVEQVAADQAQRDAINNTLGEGSAREAELQSLQDQVKKLAP